MTNKTLKTPAKWPRQEPSYLPLMRPHRWPAEVGGEQHNFERMSEDAILNVARLLLSMDPQCKNNACARKICERTKCCEKWAQNVRQCGVRGAEVPDVKIIQRMMLEMIRRYGVAQRTQIR